MNRTEYLAHDGLALGQLVRQGVVTAGELVEAAIDQIDAANPLVNAVIHRMDAVARAAAPRIPRDGPFAGVPLLVKDLVQVVAGEPYRAGTRFLQGMVPDHDSELIRRMRRAGFIPVGKTNVPEFGLTPYTEPALFGPTRNPWNLECTSGGSSGGSAAAVAAGMVPIATGSDGGGSIRIPASCCGLFGLKPTRERTPLGPDVGQLWHGSVIDHVLTRSVRDSAAVLDQIAGRDVGAFGDVTPPKEPFAVMVDRPPDRLRIGYSATSMFGGMVHPDCRASLDDAVALVRSLGHDVVEASPSVDGSAFARAFLTMVCCECSHYVAEIAGVMRRPPSRDELEPTTRALALLGRAIRGDELTAAVNHLDLTSRRVGQFFVEYDILMTPTLALPPWPVGALQPSRFEENALKILGMIGSGALVRRVGLLDQLADRVFDAVPFTVLANVTGQPAMSVPLSWNRDGLPIGVQFMAPFGEEALLFRLAGQLEQARPWFHRLAPLKKPSAS